MAMVRRNAVTARSTGAQWLLSVGRTPLLRVDTPAEAEVFGRELATALGLTFDTTGTLE
ncbi:hypothetical protein [Curtobacterium sp. MCBD17_028]|uniref:hypothetical protein n=1 Tax=Curtobacterium sp. MCBD17_028 TaxID=2175670 RepID=UPI0015E88F6F|nr:hypothetical protein [Curtobacterium sp. MCBD17_028]